MNTPLEAAHDAPHTQAEFKVQAILNSLVRLWRDLQLTPRVLSGLTAQLKDACRKDPNATWHALSQLDQLHRRGVVTTQTFRDLKRDLNDIVFCNTGKYQDLPTREAQENVIESAPASKFDRVDTSATHEIQLGEEVRKVDAVLLRVVPTSRSSKIARLVVQSRAKESANNNAFDVLRPGSVLNDRYVIVEPLTAGSATITFKALDKRRDSLPESERHVAIRWLEEHLQDNNHAATAMQNEFAQLQLIAHTGIPKVFDIHSSRGSTFIAMELLSGDSLTRILERVTPKRLPVANALTVVREVGLALANAHANGVTHGALHPGSVRITHGGEVRVYGFAQADEFMNESHDDRAPPSTLSTLARRYCSPQRLLTAKADRSDDLYSLACIAFELLCGEAACIEALQANRWQAPECAKHLSKQRWRALAQGLSHSREKRGYDVRRWLNDLGMEEAEWKLPGLATLEAQATTRRRWPEVKTIFTSVLINRL